MEDECKNKLGAIPDVYQCQVKGPLGRPTAPPARCVHKFDKRASASSSRSPIKILNEPGPTTEPCDGPASCLAQLEPAKSPNEASKL